MSRTEQKIKATVRKLDALVRQYYKEHHEIDGSSLRYWSANGQDFSAEDLEDFAPATRSVRLTVHSGHYVDLVASEEKVLGFDDIVHVSYNAEDREIKG